MKLNHIIVIFFMSYLCITMQASPSVTIINQYRKPVIIKYNDAEQELSSEETMVLPDLDIITSLFIKTNRPGALYKNIDKYLLSLKNDSFLYPDGRATITILDTTNIFKWKIQTSWQHRPERPLSSPLFGTNVSTERSLQNLAFHTESLSPEYQQFLNYLLSNELDTDSIFENIKHGLLGEQAAYELKEICKLIYKKEVANICRKQKINLQLTRNTVRKAHAHNDMNAIIEWIDSFKEAISQAYESLRNHEQ